MSWFTWSFSHTFCMTCSGLVFFHWNYFTLIVYVAVFYALNGTIVCRANKFLIWATVLRHYGTTNRVLVKFYVLQYFTEILVVFRMSVEMHEEVRVNHYLWPSCEQVIEFWAHFFLLIFCIMKFLNIDNWVAFRKRNSPNSRHLYLWEQ